MMFVYNDPSMDARVQRAADSLSEICDDFILVGCGGNKYINEKYQTIILNSEGRGLVRYFKTLRSLKKVIDKHKYDIFYGHDFYAAIPSVYSKKNNECKKLIYDAHELYFPGDGRKITLKSLFFYFAEKRAIKKADFLICAQSDRGRIMKDHYKLTTIPYVIPNISTLSDDERDLGKELQGQLNCFFEIQGFSIVYVGYLDSERNIEALVDLVLKHTEKYKLLIIGGGPHRGELESRAESAKDRILFTGALPYEQLGGILKRCDIGYLYYPDGELNCKYCASNKVYEYASVCLPVLANENPTVKKMYDRWKIGVCDNDVERGIEKLLKNLDEYKANCVPFNENYDWVKVKKEYQETIEEFLNGV